MTPEQRDALIDATAEQCAKIAEQFHTRDDVPKESIAQRLYRQVGAAIAAEIRRELGLRCRG